MTKLFAAVVATVLLAGCTLTHPVRVGEQTVFARFTRIGGGQARTTSA